MSQLVRFYLFIGGVNASLCVGLGAFGAHFLKNKLSETMIKTYQTGVEYHFFHVLGLFALAFLASQVPESHLVKWAGRFMITGMILFSGSLYLLSITGMRWIGAITPFGGLAFILAWILFAIAAYKS